MTKKRLAELRELCEKATPGPWTTDYPGRKGCTIDNNGNEIAVTTDAEYFSSGNTTEQDQANAALIAEARTALPEALDEIERLREALKDIHKITEEFNTKEIARKALNDGGDE